MNIESKQNFPLYLACTSINSICIYLPYDIVSHLLVSQSCPTLCDPMDCRNPPGSFCPWDSPSKNTGVGCYSLLQGIFPTQGSNPGLLHCRQMLYSMNLYHMMLPLFKYLYPHRLNNLQIGTAVYKTKITKWNTTLKSSAPSKVRLLGDDFLGTSCFPCPVLAVRNQQWARRMSVFPPPALRMHLQEGTLSAPSSGPQALRAHGGFLTHVEKHGAEPKKYFPKMMTSKQRNVDVQLGWKLERLFQTEGNAVVRVWRSEAKRQFLEFLWLQVPRKESQAYTNPTLVRLIHWIF